MKRMNLVIMLVALSFFATTARAQFEAKPFEHLSVSVNAGTLGVGAQVAAPIDHWLSLRTGVLFFTYTHDYNYKEVIRYGDYLGEAPIAMEAKANLVNGLLLADVFPFRDKRFHVTGGFYVGTSDIIKVVSRADADRVIEIGDVIIEPEHSRVAAHLQTNGFKPYLGLGFGSSVTRKNLVGFKFELGAMFHGSPQIVATEGEIVNIPGLETTQKMSDFNKFLKNFNVYPVLNFQLHFRVF